MRKLIGNKIIIYILSRYFSYFLQFINSLIVAYVLGPFYLGIWGFISLVMQYMNFGNFGVDISLNVNLSTGDLKDANKQSAFASNAIVLTTLTSAFYIIIAIILYLLDVHFFEKYMFTRFLMIVAVISCLYYFNVVFLNIYRAYSLFKPISIYQTIIQLFQLPVFLFFRGTDLIWALLGMMTLAHLLSIFIFIRYLPVKVNFNFDFLITRNLLKRGVSLLSYALTFYILLLSTRSMVGYFFPVETMGLFTFAANIASALIVGLSSLEFVLFPKMLNRLSAENLTEKSLRTFNDVRYIYMSTTFLITIIGLLCYPILLMFFKAYIHTESVFAYLVICQIIISSGFGYSTLIISQGKELFLVIHGLVALFINISVSLIVYYVFDFGYSAMPFVLVFSFVYYDWQVIRKGRELLGLSNDFKNILTQLIPIRSLLPLVLLFIAGLTGYYTICYILALISFILFNLKGFTTIKDYARTLFNEPTVVNI